VRAIPEDEFLDWAEDRGVGLDERHTDARHLLIQPDRDFDRLWKRPLDITATRELIGHVLDAMEPRSHVGVGSRSPKRPGRVLRSILDDGRILNEPHDPEHVAPLELSGVPFGEAAALACDASGRAELMALIEAQARFGRCVDDDVFVLPDHGKHLLHVDHHDVTWMSCRQESGLSPAVRFLGEPGHPLPDELPDKTFKPRGWIDEDVGKWKRTA
jgi:hypothetical protein